jgi:hypothetical protein
MKAKSAYIQAVDFCDHFPANSNDARVIYEYLSTFVSRISALMSGDVLVAPIMWGIFNEKSKMEKEHACLCVIARLDDSFNVSLVNTGDGLLYHGIACDASDGLFRYVLTSPYFRLLDRFIGRMCCPGAIFRFIS